MSFFFQIDEVAPMMIAAPKPSNSGGKIVDTATERCLYNFLSIVFNFLQKNQ